MKDPNKKPRVARAPKVVAKVEVTRFALTEGETEKLYKIMDGGLLGKTGFTSALKTKKFLIDAAQARSENPLKVTMEFKLDTANILWPVVVVMDFPAPKVVVPRKKAAPKAKPAGEALPKLPRKPKSE